MIRAYLYALVILVAGGFSALLFVVVSPFLGLVVAVLSGVVALLYTYRSMPALAEQAWLAEENNGVLVLLHGNDLRVYPVATAYYRRTNTLTPINRLRDMIFIPDPDSTLPVHGMRAKITNLHIDLPFTLSPKHILIAYDLKRMGLENIAQAIDFVKHYDNPEKLLEEIQAVQNELNNIEQLLKYQRLEDMPDELRRQIGVETPLEWSEYRAQLGEEYDRLRQYLEDLKHTHELLQERGGLPAIRVLGKFYTVKEAIGYLGTVVNVNKLMNLFHAMKREAQIRSGSTVQEVLKWGILIMMIVMSFVIALMAMSYFAPGVTHATPTSHPTMPQIIPQPLNLTTNATG